MTILQVESHEQDGAMHVALRGELDLSTVGKVEEELGRVEAKGPPLMVLDLSRLTFLDSSGLRCVLTAAERAHEQQRRFVILRGPDAVHRVFEITRLDERLEIVDDAPGAASAD